MTVKAEGLKIDDAGFFTPGKGINQMMISLLIWFLTGIIYKISTFIFLSVQYELVCFLSSLSLSIISGIMISRKLLMHQDASKKFLFGLANILLLYTSANGMQSAYCFVYQPGANENIKAAFIIPFPEARPWLPDLFHVSIILDLTSENERLKSDLSDAISTTTGDNTKLLNEMRYLRDENSRLRAQIDTFSKTQQPLDQVPSQTDNSDLHAQIETLLQRINAFNTRQIKWKAVENAAYNRTKGIKEQVNSLINSADPNDGDFYEFIFNTPIDVQLPSEQSQKQKK